MTISLRSMLKRFLLGPEIPPANVERFLRSRKRLVAPSRKPRPATLAIVVPCYGHAPYLAEMFESITLQTKAPDQVIFINDASPDNTGCTLWRLLETKRCGPETEYLVLENERNMGQAESLNRGIAATTTDLIMILNDDDYLFHDCVEAMFTLFSRYPQIYLIGGTSRHFSGKRAGGASSREISAYAHHGQIELEIRMPSQVPGYRCYNDLNMTHSGTTFLKEAWEAAGGYTADKALRLVPYSDRDFQLRVNALFPVGLSPRVPFSFWRTDSSVDRGKNS